MATIKRDLHGLYAKVGGYIARPVFPAGYNHVYKDETAYVEGDKVNARHSGGALAKVGSEKWYLHGAYINTYPEKDSKSEELFKPSYKYWH